MLDHVDLCSGIGGFALGFQWAGLSRPVMFCDIEPWSRKILAKHWPDVPIQEDVKVLANEPKRIPELGRNSILTAGYPCQPFSQAGKRRGEEDDRHIWPYIRQIVASKRPAWCVFENVYGHVSMGLDTVLSDLEADGYATRPFIVPACGVDAPHRRDRIWIIARAVSDTTGNGLQGIKQSKSDGESSGTGFQPEPAGVCGGKPTTEDVGYSENIRRDRGAEAVGRAGQAHQQGQSRSQVWSEPSGSSADVADTEGERVEGDGATGQQEPSVSTGQKVSGRNGSRGQPSVWLPEPSVGRVANGVSRRVDRIKGLGNAIVPQIAMQIGLTIKAVHDV